MKIARNSLLQVCGLAFVTQLSVTGVAIACPPSITAEAYCSHQDFKYYIDYTATSPCTGLPVGSGCGNPQVDIFVGGELKDTGAFEFPAYAFSGGPIGPYVGPAGASLPVQLVVGATWDDDNIGGQTAGTMVTFPEDPLCAGGTGRFTGGGSQIRIDGVRVTRGLTIHCDLLLSNNLEVNWNGNKFHMTEHLTTVACTDDPLIVQFPPAAPLDTLIGVGTGRYNGDNGYTIEFTLVDYGEPGSSDQMAIRIFETLTPTNVVLDIPLQVLSGGNLQAHYDQPHK